MVPCELYRGVKPQFAQTFVIKSDASSVAALRTFGASQLVTGAGAFAVVQPIAGAYLVLTLGEPHRFENRAAQFRQGLQQLPGSPQIEWIRPLTRRLQRLFGWGDVSSTRADVVRACEAKDEDELRALMPQAARFIERAVERADFALLPALHDALRSPQLALEDCRHEFFQESRFDLVGGPCCHGARDTGKLLHMPPYTRCGECRAVWCAKCARLHGERQEERQEWQDDVKEALRECQRPPPFAPQTSWQQHPTRPLPMYVMDHQKVPNTEKLAWLRQELGPDAPLEDFARKFLELFEEKVHASSQQRSLVLKLFSAYAPEGSPARKWRKESDLPPADCVEFLRVWNPDAPARCHECGKALTGNHPILHSYCSQACRHAGTRTACARCKKVLEDPVHPYCTVCKLGAPALPPNRPAPGAEQAMLDMAQRVWFSDQRKDPDHEPAWKRRRRS